MTIEELSDDELVERCLTHGIRLDVPLSQFEAEAIRRDIDLASVIRACLLRKLEGGDAR